MSQPPVIVVSAVVFLDDSGALLTVRKRGTGRFMLPGGKPEPGESALAAAVRECAEEIGVDVDPSRLVEMGTFEAAAANEANHRVRGTVFRCPDPLTNYRRAAEIAELRWIDIDPPSDEVPLAPLLAEHVLPHLRNPAARA